MEFIVCFQVFVGISKIDVGATESDGDSSTLNEEQVRTQI